MAALNELTQQLQELAAQYTALGTRLALAAGELQNLGTPPTVGLVEEVATYRQRFDGLQKQAIALAKANQINENAIPMNMVSVRELEAFLESLSQPSAQLTQGNQTQAPKLVSNDRIYGATPPADQMTVVGLEVMVHIEGIGDRKFSDHDVAGTQGESRRLEGVQLSFNPRMAGLGIRYMGHVENVGDTPWVGEGQYVGSRGDGLRLEGFAAELTGPLAEKFDICYLGHFSGHGDSNVIKNGELCGMRGESLCLESLKIWLEVKNA